MNLCSLRQLLYHLRHNKCQKRLKFYSGSRGTKQNLPLEKWKLIGIKELQVLSGPLKFRHRPRNSDVQSFWHPTQKKLAKRDIKVETARIFFAKKGVYSTGTIQSIQKKAILWGYLRILSHSFSLSHTHTQIHACSNKSTHAHTHAPLSLSYFWFFRIFWPKCFVSWEIWWGPWELKSFLQKKKEEKGFDFLEKKIKKYSTFFSILLFFAFLKLTLTEISNETCTDTINESKDRLELNPEPLTARFTSFKDVSFLTTFSVTLNFYR